MKISNILNGMGLQTEKIKLLDVPLEDTFLDEEKILGIVEEYGDAENISIYADMYISQNTFVPLLMVSSAGIFAYLPYEDDAKNNNDLKIRIKELYDYFHLPAKGTYIFVFSLTSEDMYIVSEDKVTYYLLDDGYEAFKNILGINNKPLVERCCYANLSNLDLAIGKWNTREKLEEVEDTGTPTFIQSIISKQKCDEINKLAEPLPGNKNDSSKVRYDEDGIAYVEHYGSNAITGLITEKQWYPCYPDNPDRAYISMFFGGWFGIHKFKERHLAQGIFYALTCGCFGIFYVFDLIAMLTGTYSQIWWDESESDIKKMKKRVYYMPMENKWLGILIPFAVVIAFVLSNTVYRGAYSLLTKALTDLAESAVQSGIIY